MGKLFDDWKESGIVQLYIFLASNHKNKMDYILIASYIN